MFTKRNKIMYQILWLDMLFCFIGFLFAMPCLAQSVPKGKAVIVTSESFTMKGGDCHTASGGAAIYIGTLIHEGLVGRQVMAG